MLTYALAWLALSVIACALWWLLLPPRDGEDA